MKRNPSLVHREQVGLLIIDIQDRVNRVMQHPDWVVANSVKII